MSLFAVDSDAAITFNNPVRTVSSSNNKGSLQAVTAPGSAPFDETSRVDWSESWPSHNTTGHYYSTASQDSSITAAGITAKGSVKGTGSFEYWGTQPLNQRSKSSFAVGFTIDTPTTIFLTGVLDLLVDTGGSNLDLPEVWVTLSGQSGQLFSQHLNAFNSPFGSNHLQFDNAFASMAAGQYNLTVYAETIGDYHNFGIGGNGSASYDLTLIPEPSLFLLAGLGGSLSLMRRVRRTDENRDGSCRPAGG